MARYLRQSNIEQFVDAYVSKLRNSNNLRKERPFIDKAIKLIVNFLIEPCCVNPDFEITFASRDNALTLFVKANLNSAFDKRRHKNSLIRTKLLLDSVLEDTCCCAENEYESAQTVASVDDEDFVLATFCGVSVRVPVAGGAAAIGAAIVAAFTATKLFTGVFSYDGSINYVGCACTDGEIVLVEV